MIDNQFDEMYLQAEQQYEMQLEEVKPQLESQPKEDEMNEEERRKRKLIMDAQLKCKNLVYQIHCKDLEIEEIKREIDDHKRVLDQLQHKPTTINKSNYISERHLIAYDSYLRATTREQDRKIYELELNNAEKDEIEARIEKINKEYKKNIYPLVVGEFKNQIETEIKGYKNQVENLRTQFKDLTEDITKLKDKHHDNLDMLSTLQGRLQEQLLANEQLSSELDQLKNNKNSAQTQD